MLWGKAMAFCEDCEKRATCKAMCKELKEHLAHTCRAKNSPHHTPMADETVGQLVEHGRGRLIWPTELQDDIENYPYHGLPKGRGVVPPKS